MKIPSKVQAAALVAVLTVAPCALAQSAAIAAPKPATVQWVCVPADEVACMSGDTQGHRVCSPAGGGWSSCAAGAPNAALPHIDGLDMGTPDPHSLFRWYRRSEGLANAGIGMMIFGGLALVGGGAFTGFESQNSKLLVDGAAVAGAGAGTLLLGILFRVIGQTYTPQSVSVSTYATGRAGGIQVAF